MSLSVIVNVVDHYVGEINKRISIFNGDGQLLARCGEADLEPGMFTGAPHGIAIDNRGDLYVSGGTLQKFARV